MTYPDARTVLAQAMTERELSQAVVDLARALGWLVARWPTWRPTGTDPGVPDLLMLHGESAHPRWHAAYKPARIIVAELKTEKGRLSAAQHAWLDVLADAAYESVERHNIIVCVWRPSDLLSGRIEVDLH